MKYAHYVRYVASEIQTLLLYFILKPALLVMWVLFLAKSEGDRDGYQQNTYRQ